MLFDMVGMWFSPTDSELSDRFTVDNTPAAVFLDFVESPHLRLFSNMDEPEPMPGAIHAASERDRCFGFLILDDAPVSLGSAYFAHRFHAMEGSLGCSYHNP
jgi:hypothetical protein